MVFRLLPLILLSSLGAQVEPDKLGIVDGVVSGPGEERVPVADVWVLVGGKEVARMVADGTGSFSFPRLPPGRITIRAAHEDWTRGEVSTVLSADKLRVTVRVRVFPGGTIRGRIVDPDGEPIGAAHVVISSTEEQSSQPDLFAVTDEQGQFTFQHVLVGDMKLWAMAKGFHLRDRFCQVPDQVQLRLERAEDAEADRDLGEELQQVSLRPYRSSSARSLRNGVQILGLDQQTSEKLGLHSGDVILQVNGVPVLTPDQLKQTLASFRSRGLHEYLVRLMSMGRIKTRVVRLPLK